MPSSTLSLPTAAPIDLHLHTRHSDGDWLPEDLLDHLAVEGFGLAAVTDHDRPDTTAELQTLAAARGLPLLVGVEMTSFFAGFNTDLLCYGFDPAAGSLHDLADDVLRRQQENSCQAFENLGRQGHPLPQTTTELEAILALPAACQPHALVAFIQRQGYPRPGLTAGNLARAAGCDFAITPLPQVVEAAHACGAVCLVAHPGREDGFLTCDEDILDEIRRVAPIDGLEAYYPRHTPAQTAFFCDYANRHSLLVSAGSDSHGPQRPPIRYPAGLCRALLERLGVRVIEDSHGRENQG
jgi:predicted metal-dependent phosphoesterase TrpH